MVMRSGIMFVLLQFADKCGGCCCCCLTCPEEDAICSLIVVVLEKLTILSFPDISALVQFASGLGSGKLQPIEEASSGRLGA
jgi:hypothetical protein